MKYRIDHRLGTRDYRRGIFVAFSLLSIVYGLLSFSGCIRLTGAAGYSRVHDDEIVTKSTGFDVDSARLIPAPQP